MLYLFAITIGLCVAYGFLEHIFNLFFEKHLAHLSKRSIGSVAIIIASSLLGYYLSSIIPNEDLGNRFLHMFGGGFMGILVCFLVVKDSRIHADRFQFFVFSFFVVTALGVGNEIMECVLQNYAGFQASTSINDTWLDLISNTMGIIVGSAIFTPFISSMKSDKMDA